MSKQERGNFSEHDITSEEFQEKMKGGEKSEGEKFPDVEKSETPQKISKEITKLKKELEVEIIPSKDSVEEWSEFSSEMGYGGHYDLSFSGYNTTEQIKRDVDLTEENIERLEDQKREIQKEKDEHENEYARKSLLGKFFNNAYYVVTSRPDYDNRIEKISVSIENKQGVLNEYKAMIKKVEELRDRDRGKSCSEQV